LEITAPFFDMRLREALIPSIGTNMRGMELRDQISVCACTAQPEAKIGAYHPFAGYASRENSIAVVIQKQKAAAVHVRVRVESIEPHRFHVVDFSIHGHVSGCTCI
jgi:hypothetical protein